MKFNAFYGALLILVLDSATYSQTTPENVIRGATALMTELPTETPVVANCPISLIDGSGQWSTWLNLTNETPCWNITTNNVTHFYFSLGEFSHWENARSIRSITLNDAADTLIWSYPNSFCAHPTDMVNTKLASSATSYVIVQTSILQNDTWIIMEVEAMPHGKLPESFRTVSYADVTLTSPNYPFSFPAETSFSVTIQVPAFVFVNLYLSELHVEGPNAWLTLIGPGVNERFNVDSTDIEVLCLSEASSYTLTFRSGAAQGNGTTTYRAFTSLTADCNNDYPILPTFQPYNPPYNPPNIPDNIDKSTMVAVVVPCILFLVVFIGCLLGYHMYRSSQRRNIRYGQTRVGYTTSTPINTLTRDLPNLADASYEPRFTGPTYNGTTSYGYGNGQPEMYSQQPPMYWQATLNQPRQSLPNYDDAIKLPTNTPPAASVS